MMSLSNLLKSTTAPKVCLLHADDTYATASILAIEHIYKLFSPAIKHKIIADRYFSFDNIQDLLNDYSLFGDKNFIEINFATKPNAAQQKELLELIPNINDSTLLVVTTEKLSKTSDKWVKACDQHGIVIGLGDKDCKTIVNQILSQSQLTIRPQALDLLIDLNQANMTQLMQEVTQLTYLFPTNHTIELKDIQNIDNSEYNIYQLSNAYLSGNFKHSMKILDNIYHEPSDAILITWILNEDMKKLIKLKGKIKQNIDLRQAMSELRIWGEALSTMQSAVSRIKYNTLMTLLNQIATLDMTIKGAVTGDVHFELQRIINVICTG